MFNENVILKIQWIKKSSRTTECLRGHTRFTLTLKFFEGTNQNFSEWIKWISRDQNVSLPKILSPGQKLYVFSKCKHFIRILNLFSLNRCKYLCERISNIFCAAYNGVWIISQKYQLGGYHRLIYSLFWYFSTFWWWWLTNLLIFDLNPFIAPLQMWIDDLNSFRCIPT